MVPGHPTNLERSLGEANHAGGPNRVGGQHPTGAVDRQVASLDAGGPVLDHAPPVIHLGEPEALQPHRFVPGERHVHLDHVDFGTGVDDASLAEDVSRALPACQRVHLVAPGKVVGLGAHGRAVHPGHRTVRGVPGGLVAEHHGARPVRRGAGLRVADRVPQHR